MKYDYLISGKSKENLRMELPSLFSNYIMDLIQEQRPQHLNDMPFTALDFRNLFVFNHRRIS